MIYAGVGARKTPEPILLEMISVGRQLGELGWTLRSGHAGDKNPGALLGADLAFEKGCDEAQGKKQIFLPWRNFNGSTSPYYPPSLEAFTMAEQIHPRWDLCNLTARKLHARNCHQVLGEKLDTPAIAVICWTEGGLPVGGTATAIMLALKEGIPIFNFALPPFGAPATAEACVSLMRLMA